MNQILNTETIDIWHGSIPANAAHAMRYRQILSEDELARADRFRFPELQQKFAQRRGVLRVVLAGYLQTSPETIRFRTNAHGKPFLCEQCNDIGLQFSLSHSKDRMLIAVTRDRNVGIDVEVIRQEIDDVGLAKSFFAPEDVNFIISQSELIRRRRCFFEVWTGKEAYVKAIGEGLSIPLDQFSIDLDSNPPLLRYANHQSQLPNVRCSDWMFAKLNLQPEETACLAYTGSLCETRTLDLPIHSL